MKIGDKEINLFKRYLNLFNMETELPWPSGYELRLSFERSQVLILAKSPMDNRKGIQPKNAHCFSKSSN